MVDYDTHTHRYDSGKRITHTHLMREGDDAHGHDYLRDTEYPFLEDPISKSRTKHARMDEAFYNVRVGRFDSEQRATTYDGWYTMAESMPTEILERLLERYHTKEVIDLSLSDAKVALQFEVITQASEAIRAALADRAN